MWLHSKPKNRRFEREHVLDVKMRSHHTRTARLRLARTVVGGFLGATLGVLGLWHGSQWVLDKLVFRNPAFNIREPVVVTDGVLPTSQILEWAGIKAGDNLFTLDLPRIERDLELQPLILRAVVVRELPCTLNLRIFEREPVAQISGYQANSASGEVKSTVFYLDESGCVMSPLESPDAPFPLDPLPVVTGVRGTELRPGKRIESAQMRAALRLITTFGQSTMAGLVDLKAIDLSIPGGVQVLTRQGHEITFPLDAPERYLRRWRTVHDFAGQEGKAIATLDLSVANNVPVLWNEAGLLPPVPVIPLKPSRYKKKHV